MELLVTYQEQGDVEKSTLPLWRFDSLESEREDQLVEEDEDVDEPAEGDVDDEEMSQQTCLQQDEKKPLQPLMGKGEAF